MKHLVFAAMLSAASCTAIAHQAKSELQTAALLTVVIPGVDFEEITVYDIPGAVLASVAEDYPTGHIERAYRNEKNQYKLELIMESGSTKTVYANAQGHWIQL